MEESDKAFEAATRGVALILLSEAFIEVANALLARDRAGGELLLHELQNGVGVNLRRFASDHPEVYRRDIGDEAAARVRAVLQAAQGEVDG